MAKYKQNKDLDLPKLDEEMLAYWQKHDIFQRSMKEREGQEKFVFYEGPPSANGKPGIHHVMARSIKDSFCRYQTMKGKYVRRKAGWDTHGLPIELAVEKKLGITKEDIGTKISVADYNKECRKTVMEYKDLWDNLTKKMGYWVDLDAPYVTYENRYIETVWHLLKRLYNKNYLYKGYTIQPYSPAAGTGLSSHELNQPGCYKEVSDTTVVAQFKAKANALLPENTYFLAWTTTPWTLPSNTALTVGAKITYVLVNTFNQYTGEAMYVVLAKNLVKKQFTGKYKPADEELTLATYEHGQKKIPYQVEKEFLGADLVGIHYEQLLPYAQPDKSIEVFFKEVFGAEVNVENAFKVISGDFVTTEDGTGIVHTAPTFGADDAMVARKHQVPPLLVKNEEGEFVPLVDFQGRFRPEMGEFGGRYVKNEYYKPGEAPERSTDVELAIKLKTENKAFKVEKYAHNYPHCWRTDKPVLYYPLDSWFVRASSAKKRMAELNKTINWKPKSTGEGRFGGWLENLQDWNLSRSRFWGIPLPIWRGPKEGQEICIGSVRELIDFGYLPVDKVNDYFDLEGTELPLDEIVPMSSTGDYTSLKEIELRVGKDKFFEVLDLHKPFADDVVLINEGYIYQRESDLIDVWFDSGSMPYAQWGLKPNSKDELEGVFPADFIAEGVDQTRGWFYTLHAIATMCFDSVAYKNVMSNGLVLDKNGQKMSKSKGNAVDPFMTINTYGTDATRWYMLTNAQPWDNLKFDLEGVDETRRKLFGKLQNIYNFFALYAEIDGFYYNEEEVALEERPEIDRWIISLLNSLVKEVDADFANYEPTNAGRKIFDFVDNHLSNWYVRLCRRRFWKGEQNDNKLAAYQTLYTCLLTLSKLMAPIAPFYSDYLYQNLNNATTLEKHDSVHLAFFPTVREDAIDKALEERMDYAQRIASLVLSLRKREDVRIRVRQPLQKILLPILDEQFEAQVEKIKDLVLSEVNVKEIEYVKDTSGIIKKGAKPNFRTLGKKLGKKMKSAKALIEGLTQEAIAQLEREGKYPLEVEGEPFDLLLEDVVIASEDLEGWQVANDGPLVVALDVNITAELYAEGMARELVNRVQNIRKDKDFEVTDRIVIQLEPHNALENALANFKEYICNEVLATDLQVVDGLAEGDAIELVDDVQVKVNITRNG